MTTLAPDMKELIKERHSSEKSFILSVFGGNTTLLCHRLSQNLVLKLLHWGMPHLVVSLLGDVNLGNTLGHETISL
jgi:hypothetical protein